VGAVDAMEMAVMNANRAPWRNEEDFIAIDLRRRTADCTRVECRLEHAREREST
jgi:hypothetical protein